MYGKRNLHCFCLRKLSQKYCQICCETPCWISNIKLIFDNKYKNLITIGNIIGITVVVLSGKCVNRKVPILNSGFRIFKNVVGIATKQGMSYYIRGQHTHRRLSGYKVSCIQ